MVASPDPGELNPVDAALGTVAPRGCLLADEDSQDGDGRRDNSGGGLGGGPAGYLDAIVGEVCGGELTEVEGLDDGDNTGALNNMSVYCACGP